MPLSSSKVSNAPTPLLYCEAHAGVACVLGAAAGLLQERFRSELGRKESVASRGVQ